MYVGRVRDSETCMRVRWTRIPSAVVIRRAESLH